MITANEGGVFMEQVTVDHHNISNDRKQIIKRLVKRRHREKTGMGSKVANKFKDGVRRIQRYVKFDALSSELTFALTPFKLPNKNPK